MKSIHRHLAIRRVRIAVLALVAGLLANSSCARDTSGPELVPLRSTANLLAQDLAPNQDVSNPGSWESTTAGLWSSMDEVTPNDDSDYAYRNHWGTEPIYAQATVQFTNPVEAPDPSQTVWLKVRCKFLGNYSTNTPQPTLLHYELFEGTKKLGSGTIWPSTSYVTDSISFSASASHWNWITLRLSAQLKAATDFDMVTARVTWATLQIR